MLFTFAPRTAAADRRCTRSAGCSRAATARPRSSRSAHGTLRAPHRRRAGARRLARRRARSGSPAASTSRRRWSWCAHERAIGRQARAATWTRCSAPRFLPFADAATPELPLGRLLRLSLFQVSVGMAVVLLIGTLNRVMIVELGVPAWLVAVMVALPLVFAPFRALVGFRSDTHRSVLGWRRVPYHLDRHAAAVRRPRDHAVRAAGAVGRHARPARRRPGRRRRSPSCWSAPGCTRRRPSASRSPPISRRPKSQPQGRGAAVRDAAGRHDRQRAGVRRAAGAISARSG